MGADELYYKREQSLVKHTLLRKYLQRFAHIVFSGWRSITYVECFSGPWNVRSNDLQDSSFHIAIEQLRQARETHDQRGRRNLEIRCLFLEKAAEPYRRLEEYAKTVEDISVTTRNAAFEDVVPYIVRFIEDGGPDSFPFIFVDPTGWSGASLTILQPLLSMLQRRRGEIIINLMSGFVRRFIESQDEGTRKSFEQLFASDSYLERVEGLSGLDRDDAIVESYVERVKELGGFQFVCWAIILRPTEDALHFHLVYGTQNLKGVEVFKDAERRAMAEQERVRAEAKKRKRDSDRDTIQQELFEASELDPQEHYNKLRERFLRRARTNVEHVLRRSSRVCYEDAWWAAMRHPLVWEADLKDWIERWGKEDKLDIVGLAAGRRVPQLNQSHVLVWKG